LFAAEKEGTGPVGAAGAAGAGEDAAGWAAGLAGLSVSDFLLQPEKHKIEAATQRRTAAPERAECLKIQAYRLSFHGVNGFPQNSPAAERTGFLPSATYGGNFNGALSGDGLWARYC
jgi:hypothetical protein